MPSCVFVYELSVNENYTSVWNGFIGKGPWVCYKDPI